MYAFPLRDVFSLPDNQSCDLNSHLISANQTMCPAQKIPAPQQGTGDVSCSAGVTVATSSMPTCCFGTVGFDRVFWFLMALCSWYGSWIHPKWETSNHTLKWPKQHSTASWEPPWCTRPHFRKSFPQLPSHTHTDINNFYPFSSCQRSEMFSLEHTSSFPRRQNIPPPLLPPVSVCGFLPVEQ